MNVKAEKIEQIIQIVNRNLKLVQAGQDDSVTPFEFRHLQRIDTGIFGTDKFAFEMIHFVKSANENKPLKGSLLQKWERSFLRGLETLLVECGVVKDDIERECFVSRVYGWFTEKMSERRDLPRPQTDNLRLKALDMYNNAIAITHPTDASSSSVSVGSKITFAQKVTSTSTSINNNAGDNNIVSPASKTTDITDNSPMLQHQQSSTQQHSQILSASIRYDNYNNHVTSLLPRIPINSAVMAMNNTAAGIIHAQPNASNNYGLLYNKPESEAEIIMQEMWLAKRRQEAFDWKAQQQMVMLMDRMGLHKSRIESETLRRQESGCYLALSAANETRKDEVLKQQHILEQSQQQQSGSGGYNTLHSHSQHQQSPSSNSLQNPLLKKIVTSTSSHSFSGNSTALTHNASSGDRPLSAKRQHVIVAHGVANEYHISPDTPHDASTNSKYKHLISPTTVPIVGLSKGGNITALDTSVVKDTSVTVNTNLENAFNNAASEVTVAKASRTAVPKSKTATKEYVPMRFRGDYGTSNVPVKIQKYEYLHSYLQHADLDEEEEMGVVGTKQQHHRASTSSGQQQQVQTAAIKHNGSVNSGGNSSSVIAGMSATAPATQPVMNLASASVQQQRKHHSTSAGGSHNNAIAYMYDQRPSSAKIMKDIARDDPEIKVFYRYSNCRRMPFTEDMQQWIIDEQNRVTREQEVKARLLAEEDNEKKSKKEGGTEGKAKKGSKKEDKNKKDSKNSSKKLDAKTGKPTTAGAVGTGDLNGEVAPLPAFEMPQSTLPPPLPLFDAGNSAKLPFIDPTHIPISKPTTAQSVKTIASIGGSNTSSMHGTLYSYNLYNVDDIDDKAYGPMRTIQLIECNKILDACEKWDVPMDSAVLYKAIVTPQDKPYTVINQIQNRTNPTINNGYSVRIPNLPKEYWNYTPTDGGAGKKKKKGSKKKKK